MSTSNAPTSAQANKDFRRLRNFQVVLDRDRMSLARRFRGPVLTRGQSLSTRNPNGGVLFSGTQVVSGTAGGVLNR